MNIERFKGNYIVELLDTDKGDTVLEFLLTEEDFEGGKLEERFKNFGVEGVSKSRVTVEFSQDYGIGVKIICDVFVNGVIVKDLEEELGVGQ